MSNSPVVTSTPAVGQVNCSKCGVVVDSEVLAGDDILDSFRTGHLDLHLQYDSPTSPPTLDDRSPMTPMGGREGLRRTVDRWDYEGGGYDGVGKRG